MTEPVRIGFLGAGFIATFHSKLLRRCGEDIVRAGVYDRDRARAEEFAAASGHQVCESEEEVLAGCDAVYICTWTSEHRRLVELACENRLAIFCEKPLARSLAEAEAMVATVRDAGVVNQVGLVLRRSPAFVTLRELIHDPDSGRPMSVVFRDDQHIPIRGAYRSTWRGDFARSGGGTLIEHSIHDVDLLEWMLGHTVGVSATSRAFHGIEGIEDLVAATLEFENGAVATLTSIWHDIDSRGSLRRVEAFNERLWAATEGDWFGPVEWMHAQGKRETIDAEELVRRADEILDGDTDPAAAFVRAARKGEPAHPNFETALRAHRVVDALYRSAADNGTRIALE